MEIEVKKIKDLKPNPLNPRKSSVTQDENLKKSLEKFGVVEPIVFNKRSGYIVGGHFRVRELKKLGYKEVECVIVDLNEQDEKELLIRLNANTGDWDTDLLLQDWDADKLADWGVDFHEIETAETVDAKEDDYEIPDQIETDIVLGDLFEIGCHRLLCGDSKDYDTVEKLMNGQKADISFQSPPYNAGDNRLGGNKNKTESKYENYNDDNANEWLELVQLSTVNAIKNSIFAFINIQQLAGNKFQFIELLNSFKENFVDEMIWFKGQGNPAIAPSVLNSRFEKILIFKDDKYPSRSINVVKFRGSVSNVYEGNGQTNNEFKEYHAATFPVHLPSHFISTFTIQSVLDLFGGTGTTMVAAHQLKRKCFMQELSPKYCQIIVDRMKKLDPSLVIKKNGKTIE